MLTLGVGFLLVLVDDRRRGLHDRMAGTLVIHAPRAGPPEARSRASRSASARERARGRCATRRVPIHASAITFRREFSIRFIGTAASLGGVWSVLTPFG